MNDSLDLFGPDDLPSIPDQHDEASQLDDVVIATKPKSVTHPKRKRQKRLPRVALELWEDLTASAPADHPALRDYAESIPKDARLIDLEDVALHGESLTGWLALPLYNHVHTLTGLAFLSPDGRSQRFTPEAWPTGAWLANHDQPSGGNLLACMDLADGAALSSLNLPVMACLTTTFATASGNGRLLASR